VSHLDPLQPLAEAIAERVWAQLQQRLSDMDAGSVQLLSIPEAARRIGIKKTKMHELVSSGEIPAKLTRRIGRRVLIVASELERWASAQ
jgi:excisionase family DNA binding protein